MNLDHLIDKYELNPLEQQIMEYMHTHIDQLKNIGIRKMAKDNFTSTSVIYKLCSKLGYEGYSDMIYHLTSTNKLQSNHFDYPYKKEFQQLLNQCEQVIVMGLGFSAPITEYMHQRLTLKGYRSFCCLHMEMFNQLYNKNTLFIVVSHSGNTQHLVNLIHSAKKNDVPVISFVSNVDSFIGTNSTLTIPIGEYDSLTHDLNNRNLFFGKTLLMFENLLFDN